MRRGKCGRRIFVWADTCSAARQGLSIVTSASSAPSVEYPHLGCGVLTPTSLGPRSYHHEPHSPQRASTVLKIQSTLAQAERAPPQRDMWTSPVAKRSMVPPLARRTQVSRKGTIAPHSPATPTNRVSYVSPVVIRICALAQARSLKLVRSWNGRGG